MRNVVLYAAWSQHFYGYISHDGLQTIFQTTANDSLQCFPSLVFTVNAIFEIMK